MYNEIAGLFLLIRPRLFRLFFFLQKLSRGVWIIILSHPYSFSNRQNNSYYLGWKSQVNCRGINCKKNAKLNREKKVLSNMRSNRTKQCANLEF